MKEQTKLNCIGYDLANLVLKIPHWRTNKRMRHCAERYLKQMVNVTIVHVDTKIKEIDEMIPDVPHKPLF